MSSSHPIAPDTASNRTQQNRAFVTTHWSVVVQAGHGESTRAQEALAKLCRIYWYPLYAYVRQRGYSAEDAQDLTQEFFARLLEKNWVAAADRDKGRFRSFLLTMLKRFLSDEWDKIRAKKRGGGSPPVPLQLDTAETRYGLDPADNATPESCYERRWALTLLDVTLKNLQRENVQEGNSELFAAISPCLIGDKTDQPYAQLAEKLGMTESAVKTAVHRMRKRYRQLLRNEISHTLSDPNEVEEEMRHLFAVLSAK